MAAKMPAFQFYPADWLKDPNLQSCSLAAKGLWIEILCKMHEMPIRGVLRTSGAAWSKNRIVRSINGATAEQLEELIEAGVLKCNRSGVFYSARMLKDFRSYQAKARAGSKGGSQVNGKQTASKTQANAKQTPSKTQAKRGSSSSSSVSSSTSKKSNRFCPPTVDEVRAYCQERGNSVAPQKFIDHYEANGWVRGKAQTPIKDWKACVRTWEGNENKRGSPEKLNDDDPNADWMEYWGVSDNALNAQDKQVIETEVVNAHQ